MNPLKNTVCYSADSNLSTTTNHTTHGPMYGCIKDQSNTNVTAEITILLFLFPFLGVSCWSMSMLTSNDTHISPLKLSQLINLHKQHNKTDNSTAFDTRYPNWCGVDWRGFRVVNREGYNERRRLRKVVRFVPSAPFD